MRNLFLVLTALMAVVGESFYQRKREQKKNLEQEQEKQDKEIYRRFIKDSEIKVREVINLVSILQDKCFGSSLFDLIRYYQGICEEYNDYITEKDPEKKKIKLCILEGCSKPDFDREYINLKERINQIRASK